MPKSSHFSFWFQLNTLTAPPVKAFQRIKITVKFCLRHQFIGVVNESHLLQSKGAPQLLSALLYTTDCDVARAVLVLSQRVSPPLRFIEMNYYSKAKL